MVGRRPTKTRKGAMYARACGIRSVYSAKLSMPVRTLSEANVQIEQRNRGRTSEGNTSRSFRFIALPQKRRRSKETRPTRRPMAMARMEPPGLSRTGSKIDATMDDGDRCTFGTSLRASWASMPSCQRLHGETGARCGSASGYLLASHSSLFSLPPSLSLSATHVVQPAAPMSCRGM